MNPLISISLLCEDNNEKSFFFHKELFFFHESIDEAHKEITKKVLNKLNCILLWNLFNISELDEMIDDIQVDEHLIPIRFFLKYNKSKFVPEINFTLIEKEFPILQKAIIK